MLSFKKNKWLKWLMSVYFCLLVACTQVIGAGGKTDITRMPVKIIFSGNQCACGQDEFGVKQLVTQTDIDSFMVQNNNKTIGISKPEADAIKLSQNVVVAVWMGQRPTAGYKMMLVDNLAQIEGNVAIIRLAVKTPKPESRVAQVVTSPCLLLKLPKANYNIIKLLSQDDQELAQLTILE